MNAQHIAENESFVDDIFQKPPSHGVQTKLKLDFQPWHKPRKQYVRKKQWIGEIEKLVNKLRDSTSLKYLSLPGKSMIDVRCVHRWCMEKKINLKYLGYNDPNDPTDPSDAELNLSVAELALREYIDKNSEVVTDRFEKIGDRNSLAYRKMIEAGPFDVINIDLCNGIAKPIPLNEQDDYYNAIYEMIQFQKTHRNEPWLLFITTRTDEQNVSVGASWKLYESIEGNAQKFESFRKLLLENLKIQCSPVTDPSVRSKKYMGMQYRNLVSLGFGKWLLGLLFNGQPKWRLQMLDSVEYTINHRNISPDMISLAFECSMIIEPPNDNIRFTNNTFENRQLSEEIYALDLIGNVNSIKDIDVTLAGDQVLLQILIEESATLMSDARFDGEAYKKWAASL
ncbi:MAG TPA: hypothetical protein DDY32_05590 [Desulfobulbaceae bacterium]|nr:hypothetical protein [Desulfobulbaceae bacterium]